MMDNEELQLDGLRERKRRDTFQRIAQTGLELFIAKGYEVTTLDDIAAASGISRRTFFHYFKSKDEILLAWQSGLADSIRDFILEAAADQSPLDALCGALLKLAAPYDSDTTIVIARLLRSSDQLRAANQAKFLRLEQAAFEALCNRWPQRARREGLRMVAMVGLGAFRIAVDEWTDAGGKEPFTKRIKKAFADLRTELQRMPPPGSVSQPPV
jgi:AcrR family transcriptional regulator